MKKNESIEANWREKCIEAREEIAKVRAERDEARALFRSAHLGGCIFQEMAIRAEQRLDVAVTALRSIQKRFDDEDTGGFPKRPVMAWAMWRDAKSALAQINAETGEGVEG